MRRSFEDFSAEVFRRRDVEIEKRKKQRAIITYLAPLAICLTLFFSTVVVMPQLLKGGSGAFDSDDDIMDGENSDNQGDVTDKGEDKIYPIAISYITVYTEQGRRVYSNAEDVWDVFLYVEDYPDAFIYSGEAPDTPMGAYYKVMVCLRDGTVHYYLLDNLTDDEIVSGFEHLLDSMDTQ
ncbi:MAG: hypothetical protein IKB34_08495 [Clostridia bacterium]|nr:hypothetical protein [Clostridia bacterium]